MGEKTHRKISGKKCTNGINQTKNANDNFALIYDVKMRTIPKKSKILMHANVIQKTSSPDTSVLFCCCKTPQPAEKNM